MRLRMDVAAPVDSLALRRNAARTVTTPAWLQKRKCRPAFCRTASLVDVQQRLNCALPSFLFEPHSLSFVRSSRRIAADDQLIHPRDLAVDLFQPLSNKFECDEFLLRKEVIQPQVPLRLPCYDFIPVTAHSVDGCFPCGLARRLRLQATPMM
jgi:hypothetical protein